MKLDTVLFAIAAVIGAVLLIYFGGYAVFVFVTC